MADVQPITQVFSEEDDNLVILYGDNDEQTFKAIGLVVNQSVRRIERPQSLPTISEGGTLQFGYFAGTSNGTAGHSADVSNPGDDVLRVASNKSETLIEYGIGIKPDDLLIGLEVAGEEVIGFQGPVERINTFQNNPSELEFRGGVWSHNTMTDTDHMESVPTTALAPTNKQGVLRIDDPDSGGKSIRTMYLNPNDEPAPLAAIAYGRTYHVVPITDPETVRQMYHGDGIKRRILQYGGFDNDDPSLPSSWKEGEVEVTGDDVRAKLQGGVNE